MLIFSRLFGILSAPRETWHQCAQDPIDVKRVFWTYLVPLGLIPHVSLFIRKMFFEVPEGGYALWRGLLSFALGYSMSLLATYGLARLIDHLAPKFNGEQNFSLAFQLMVYGSTASMLGGIFSILPVTKFLGIFASVYSIYLVFTGVPIMMKTPITKALPYTMIIVIGNLALLAALGQIVALFY